MKLIEQEIIEIFNRDIKLWESFLDKKIFITGGTGFLGSWLVESLFYANQKLNLNINVHLLSRNKEFFLKKHPHLTNFVKFVDGDIRDFIFPDEQFDFVIHAATDFRNIKPGEEEQILDVCYKGTQHILEFCKLKKIKKILYVSSGAVYGDMPPNKTSFSEEDLTAPSTMRSQSAYGEGKRLGEWLCGNFGRQHDIEIKIVRCFALIGPFFPLEGSFAFVHFLKDILNGEDILIKSDGKAIRSYLYASDMAFGLWKIFVDGQSSEIYNLGSPEEISIADFANKFKSITKSHVKVILQNGASPSMSTNRYVPSMKKMKSELNFVPMVNLESAILKSYEFYKNWPEELR